MRYYAPIVIKDCSATYDCLVTVDEDGTIDVSPFVCETPATRALDGVVVITGEKGYNLPMRDPGEDLERYASRIISHESQRAMMTDPSDGIIKAFHVNFSVNELF